MMAFQGKCFAAASALALSVAWGIVSAARLLPGFGSWPAQLGLLACGVLAVGAWTLVWVRRCRREFEDFARYVDAATQREEHESSGGAGNRPDLPLPPPGPWRDLAQRVRAALARWADRLSELEHAQAALEVRLHRASRQYERVKAILDAVADPIIAVDDYNELLLANPAAEELFQFDASSTERRAVGQLVRCEKLVELLSASTRRKTPGSRTEEMEIEDPRRGAAWYRVHAARLVESSDDGQQPHVGPCGAVAVLREIGSLKAMQKRNAEFVSAVSHEMKTPLAGIRAYVELLADGDAEDEAQREEFLHVIQSQADRLQRLVENLLNLARIEAGVVQVNKQRRPLNELLEEAIHVVQPSAEAKQIRLVAELSPLYLGVLADRDMLLQAAINLLSNAIKYTPQGGQVTLRSRLADDQVVFEVQDTGVGLSDEDCQRVFEKFYRVKKDQNMASGTGLGLPLAKHIVEDVHAGRLTVQSRLGVGSTFTVTLPKAGQTT